MLNFVLCDDNTRTLECLSHMFEKIFFVDNLEAKIALTVQSTTELLNYANDNPIDVLILDINLKSNLNGFDIAKKIRKFNKDCYIIFITAHSEFVFLAYQCKTFDYICKPLTFERLEVSIKRLFEDIEKSISQKKYIRLDNKNTLIDENEIQYIKRDGMKIIFCTKTKEYETYSSFNKIQNRLPDNFIRCHKSFIANINNITQLESSSNLIYFKNNEKCYIGPKYKKNLMKEVNIYE